MLARQAHSPRNPIYALYQREIRKQLSPETVPRHIAMILDGNRRWAKQLGLETAAHGHRAGADKIGEFLVWCDDLDVEVATLYLLSTDNLTGRDPAELDALFEIIGDLAADLSKFRDWRVKHVGSNAGLPDELVAKLAAAEQRHGRPRRAARQPRRRLRRAQGDRRRHAQHRRVAPSAGGHHRGPRRACSTPELISEHLYTGGQPDPDLVIRTSGEQRMSDFMLWQSAHSELYFVEALGPDLREVDFLRAVRDYGKRHRRYGG